MDMIAGRSLAQERRPIRHLDPVLLATVAILVATGIFLLYSATHQTLEQDGLDPFLRVNKQAITAVLGIVALLVLVTFDYRFLKVYAGFIYAATLGVLLLLQVPGIGSSGPGTSNYISIPGVSLLQITPAEFAKIGMLVMVAAILSELRDPIPTLSDLVRVCIVAGLVIGLVFINVEIGTTIVLVAGLVGMLVVAGTRVRHLAALAVIALLMIALAFQQGVIKEYQIQRLRAVFDTTDSGSLTEEERDAYYNLRQSQIAVGAGGVLGRGYLRGTQTNLDYVPEQHTDFIFTVVGEELGFVGAMLVLALYAILLWRAIRIAFLSKDPFGMFLAAGIASMFAVQIFVNVGMVIGIMPITGIPLPFLSFGGSAMIVNFAMVGILLSVHMRRFT
jgi:rod shape determining protein RodA